MNKLNMFIVATAVAACASPASAAITIAFGATTPAPGAAVGTSKSYTIGGLTVVASGFDQTNAATGVYEKNGGADEVGLGLTNDPTGNNEIAFGHGFLQIDISQLAGKVSNISFFLNSLSSGETYSVFGSNSSGSYSGSALLTNTNPAGASLPGLGSWKYYDFVSTQSVANTHSNFLLGGLSMTAVPEPATWATMLLGFGLMGLGFRRRRPARALSAA